MMSGSAGETLALGSRISRSLCGGEVISLIGPLGAGKTHLVRGIAAGNDQAGSVEVTSPTFALINEYPGRVRLYHLDAYRLRGADDLWAIGLEDLLSEDACTIVEWADRVRGAIPGDALWITIEPTGDETRRIELFARSGRGLVLLRSVREMT